jgi:hypothetical protein
MIALSRTRRLVSTAYHNLWQDTPALGPDIRPAIGAHSLRRGLRAPRVHPVRHTRRLKERVDSLVKVVITCVRGNRARLKTSKNPVK